MGTWCQSCDNDDVSWERIMDIGDGQYCHRCVDANTPAVQRAYERENRDRAIGHTGSDLCGCERCAAAADRGEC